MISETHDLYLLKTPFAKNCIFVIYGKSYQYNTVYAYNTSPNIEILQYFNISF